LSPEKVFSYQFSVISNSKKKQRNTNGTNKNELHEFLFFIFFFVIPAKAGIHSFFFFSSF